MEAKIIITIAVFAIFYIIVVLDLINKAAISLLGASILLMLKIIPVETAFRKIDFNVMTILLAMMVIVNIIKDTGVFHYIAIKSAKLAHGDPLKILIFLMIITAFISAFLPNVTTILIICPVSLLIAIELGISPYPFLITQAIASNIGGTATLIGDPPNIMIGYGANLSFNDFIIHMTPLIIIVTAVSVLISIPLFRKSFSVSPERKARIMKFNESEAITDKVFMVKSLSVLLSIIIGCSLSTYLGIDPTIVTFFGAALLLILSQGTQQEKYFGEVEWTTIFFFIGLYIMVGAMEEVKIIEFLGEKLVAHAGHSITMAAMTIIWGSGILSGIIDNIPFTATVIPLLKIVNSNFSTAGGDVLWWSLSAGACLGGNLTLIGASANIVVAGIGTKNGYPISFLEFTKYGIIYTLISLIISSFYIYLRYLL
jgi:Na+/H+ antiporter NhaD/arsenite permease-like protein